ncbi:MAG TPA: hypothetical protein VHM70_07070, partial [Polyangiaceae bacterium]|nr:hypothetical protein [Polyangiaceae bacterium]
MNPHFSVYLVIGSLGGLLSAGCINKTTSIGGNQQMTEKPASSAQTGKTDAGDTERDAPTK